ncbi:hypothetical protein CLOM_g20334 [Closterium sp. NIES-68]|nr:hypothetical protein CLOM_g20334 [Closterium sp. NIES-68]
MRPCALLVLLLPSAALASSTGEVHFAAQLRTHRGGMRGTISISVSRSISRGPTPAYTIRFSVAIAGAESPPGDLLLTLPRGAPPLALCPAYTGCQWVATTPSVWEVAGKSRERGGVEAQQVKGLEEMLTARGEENGRLIGFGVRVISESTQGVLVVVGGEGEEARVELAGELQRSRECSSGIIIPRYPQQDPRLEVRLKGRLGEESLQGGAFMLAAFKDGHVVLNYDIRVIGLSQKPSAINLLVAYPESGLQAASLQCDSWVELKPQMWRAQCSSRRNSGDSSGTSFDTMSEGVFNRFACFAVDGDTAPSVAVLSLVVEAGTNENASEQQQQQQLGDAHASSTSGVLGLHDESGLPRLDAEAQKSVAGAIAPGLLVGGIVWRPPLGEIEQSEQKGVSGAAADAGASGAATEAAASKAADTEAATEADTEAAASPAVPAASAPSSVDPDKAAASAENAESAAGADDAGGAAVADGVGVEISGFPSAERT